MPETLKFTIERSDDGGATWTELATQIDDTEYTYDSMEEDYTWHDENGFEHNTTYTYRVKETTEDTDWSNEESFTWDLVDVIPSQIINSIGLTV